MPAEIGGALEFAGLAGFPGAVLACRCGDGMADTRQPEVPECAAVLDDEHQGEDQNRSYEYASHGANIGIRGICLKR